MVSKLTIIKSNKNFFCLKHFKRIHIKFLENKKEIKRTQIKMSNFIHIMINSIINIYFLVNIKMNDRICILFENTNPIFLPLWFQKRCLQKASNVINIQLALKLHFP